MELEGNHIEGAARSKVSRSSSSPTAEESLGLSRVNSACRCSTFQTVLVLCVLLIWFNH